MIEDIACFRKRAQTGRFDSQNLLHFFQLGGLLNGSNTRQCGIKEVKEDKAEILVVMKSSWRMGILGRKMFKHRPERLKVFESFEGVLVDRIHGLKSPEISSLTDRERPL